MKQQELTTAAQIAQVVQPAETLSSIGRLYGVTYQAIMESNGLTDPVLIEVGQELIIPPPELLPCRVVASSYVLARSLQRHPPEDGLIVCARPSLSLCQRCGMIVNYTFGDRTAL